MSDEEFRELVHRMRELQREYFKTRSVNVLRECKECEHKVDKALEYFVRSFCRPGGTVFDPFCGSGTTMATAIRCGRNAFGIDIRKSQVELTKQRIAEVQMELV